MTPAQVAWSWLWDNIEQLLKATLGKPAVPWYVGFYMSQADVCLSPKQVTLNLHWNPGKSIWIIQHLHDFGGSKCDFFSGVRGKIGWEIRLLRCFFFGLLGRHGGSDWIEEWLDWMIFVYFCRFPEFGMRFFFLNQLHSSTVEQIAEAMGFVEGKNRHDDLSSYSMGLILFEFMFNNVQRECHTINLWDMPSFTIKPPGTHDTRSLLQLDFCSVKLQKAQPLERERERRRRAYPKGW